MNKKLIWGLAAGVVVAACVAAGRGPGKGSSPDKWTKMREKMEEMPSDFPPRAMFDNVEQTKANTEDILTLLKEIARTSV